MDNRGYVIEFEGEKDIKKLEKCPAAIQSHTFEEAVTLVGVGKFHYFLLLACGICFMAVMVEILCVSVIMPVMQCDLVSTLEERGILASAAFLGIVVSSHAMGFFADTWGRVRTLRVALILAIITTIISAFSINIWMLIVFRFLSGFFVSGGQACVFSLCGEFHGNKTRVKHVTFLSVFLPLSLIFLPVVAIVILPLRIDIMVLGVKFSSWRILLIANTCLSLLAVVSLLSLPETPKYILNLGDHDRALEIFRWIFVKNTGRPASEYPVKRIIMQSSGANLSNVSSIKEVLKLIWNQTIPLFYRERCLHTINICVIMFLLYGISQGVFMWFPTILSEMVAQNSLEFNICHVLAGMDRSTDLNGDMCSGEMDIFPQMVIMMVGVAFTVFYSISAFTIDILGKKNLIITWLLIAAVCVSIVRWTTNFYIIVVLLTLTMTVSNSSGVVSTVAMEFFPTNINAMGMCFIMMIGRLGAFFGSNFLGRFLFTYCDNTFWCLSALTCLLIVMSCLLPENSHQTNTKTSR